MAWCRDKLANGVNGFIAYSRTSARGLENQGWKDSHDSMVWPDGTLVQPPIALIEVRPGRFHYVVVLSWDAGKVVVHDPARKPFDAVR